MGKITRHPLLQRSDAIKRALSLNGFTFYDDGSSRELVETDSSVELFREPEELRSRQIITGDGSYSLRTRLLPVHLPLFPRVLPVKAAVAGRIYDGGDTQYPQRQRIEGVIADTGITLTDLQTLWNNIARNIYGIASSASIKSGESDTFSIEVSKDGSTFTLGHTGPATWIARSLMGISDPSVSVWIFAIDVDNAALHDLHLSHRRELYNNRLSFIGSLEDDTPAFGDSFTSRISDVMRSAGYVQYIGEAIYTSDAYVRMNMIQEAWDTNNNGVSLQEPLKGYSDPLTGETELTGLPTVLAPALERAMSDNFAAGERSIKIFDISHIFKPGKDGNAPWEVTSLSAGAYGPDVSFRSFLGEVTTILRKLGISNSFFIPTDMAIAYRQDQCMVILDEKMKYLDGNCGHISPVALKNFKIDCDGFMAQFEIPTLEKKASEEYGFIPWELR